MNFTSYRGPHRAPARRCRVLARPVHGPRAASSSTTSSSPTRPARRSRAEPAAAGTIDDYAAAVGRWLVTRDGFDFLVFYLSDYDYASHALGPDAAHEALARSDAAIGALFDAAGGLDEFLERYAVIVCSDHGQTHGRACRRGSRTFVARAGALVTASNRAAMLYRRRPARARALATLDGEPSVDVALFLEDGDASPAATARSVRAAGSLRRPGAPRPPGRVERAEAALRQPERRRRARLGGAGWEFADLGGRHHVGGGAHGSLAAGDSEVPMLDRRPRGEPRASITDVAPLVLEPLRGRAAALARTP